MKWTSLLILLFSLNAKATVPFDPSNFTDTSALINPTTANLLVKSTGMLGDHRTYLGARALDGFVGLEFGIEITLVKIPNELGPALQAAGLTANLPPSAPVPRLVVQKSLGKTVNVGASWVKYREYSIFGGHLQLTIIPAQESLSWGLRLSHSRAKLGFVSSNVWKPEVIASFKRGIAETYGLLGVQIINGSVSVPVSGFTATADGSAVNFLAALGVGFFFGPTGVKIGIEIGYTPSGAHIGSKVGFEF